MVLRHKKTGPKPEMVFVKRKTGYKDLMSDLYDYLERFSVFIPFLSSILNKFRVYLNDDPKECCAQAMGCLIKIYFSGTLAFCLIFGLSPSWHTFVISLYLIYFFSKEFIISSVTKLEIRFLKSFDEFLGIVRHYYYKCGSVNDALMMSEADSPKLMKGHIREMCRCLTSTDAGLEVNSFLNMPYHKYLKLFLTLTRLVDENGDIQDEKGSVFLNSCMHLKTDVEEDARFIQEKRHRFSGLVYTAVIPVTAIPYISMWGVSTIPSLNRFYNGYAGTLIKAALILVSFVCYNAIFELRDRERSGRKKHLFAEILSDVPFVKRIPLFLRRLNQKKERKLSGILKRLGEGYGVKTLYMQKVMNFVLAFIVSICLLLFGHAESADICRYDITEISEIAVSSDTRQISALERLIPMYVNDILEKGIEPDRDGLITEFLKDRDIKTLSLAETAADEVIRRVNGFRGEKMGIWDTVLSIAISVLMYFSPDISLSFRKSLIEGRIRDEIMQYQSIIHMLKKIPGVSVVSLLEEMERFSGIFGSAIRQCLNEYSISDEEALRRMYDSEKDPEWHRLTDCFLISDELGVEDAFEEISIEIENYKENRKLDRKILLDTEGMLGAVIAVLPGGLILFGYLLCPFMLRSLQIFNEYQAGISMSV